jgi:hypothetical protein
VDPDDLHGESSSPHGLRKPVPAMALRHYWTEQFQDWAHDKRIRRLGSRKLNVRVDKFVLAAAIIGLLDNMRADGALRGPHGFWSLDQLTEFMGLKHSNHTAMAILRRPGRPIPPAACSPKIIVARTVLPHQ